MALQLSDKVGLADNPELQPGIINRRAILEAKKQRLRDGDLVPLGVQQMNLVIENSVNDESKTATIVTFKRR